MSNNRGIFEPQEGFAPDSPSKSPFAVADDAPVSPFAAVAEPESPFASLKDDHPARLVPEAGRPAKLPERRPEAAPEARSPFSQEAASPAFGASPFESSTPSSPFAVERPAASSPFSTAQDTVPEAARPSPAVSAAIAAAAVASPAPPPVPAAAPTSFAATAAPAPAATETEDSDSRSIRQLELRAIFGVDRELGAEEMLQRSRSLPGIRHVARVPAQDAGAIDALKRLIPSLGFPAGQVRLQAGGVPIEFIREGGVLLAVQNDGSFAPGVKETLIIVARELGRL